MALNFNVNNGSSNNNNNLGGSMGTGLNLAKTVQAGERVNLSKTVGVNTVKYAVGLNWNSKKINGKETDCDISILLLDDSGNAIKGKNENGLPRCLAFYGQLELNGVKHFGDNRDGDNSNNKNKTNSDEQVNIDFSMLDQDASQVLIIASTHSEIPSDTPGEQGIPGTPIPFGRAAEPVLVIYDNTNEENPIPKFSFTLDEENSTSTSVEVAKFYKKNGDWIYVSMSDHVSDDPFGLQGITNKYNI